MIVERTDNEQLLVHLSTGLKTSKIQAILDYLRYEELASVSSPSEDDVKELLSDAKNGRWETT